MTSASALIHRWVFTALLLGAPNLALADTDYPKRPVKIVVPAPAGTVLDSLPRILADRLAARWGQAVIIENRPGAAQNIGAEVVANPTTPYSSFDEMLSFAKANPLKINYGSPGTGSSLHLIAEMLQVSTGV